MYTTSAFFIKAQIPGATLPVLIELYKQELEHQNVRQIEVSDNAIIFSNQSPFNITSFVIGLAVFAVYSGINFVSTLISFPVYFTSVRNDIERLLQSKTI